jgi:glycosyltransferase involved in cell wall biosynthesis
MSAGKLRILFLTPYYLPYVGGIERAIEKLSTELSKSSEVEKVAVSSGALITEFQNSSQAEESLIKLVNNREFRKKMGQEGQLVARKFTWKSCAEQHLQIYSELLSH